MTLHRPPRRAASCEGPVDVLRILLRYFPPYPGLCAAALVALAVDRAADTGVRFGFKFLIDEAIVPQSKAELFRTLGGLAGAVVAYAVAVLGRDYVYSRLGASVVNDIRNRLFEHLQTLSMSFYRREQVADIMARFSTDLDYVDLAVYYGVGTGIAAGLGVVFALIPLFALEWRLALLSLVCLPLGILGPALLGRRVSASSYVVKEEVAALSSVVHENVTAQEVTQAFGLRPRAIAAFRRQQAKVYASTVRYNMLWYVSDSTPGTMLLLSNVLILGAGAFLVFDRRMTVGTLVSFQMLLLGLHASARELMSVYVYLMQAAGGLRRIEEILGEVPSVSNDGRQVLRGISREIAFKNVSFGYRSGESQLRELAIRIPRGASVAFVGPSGAGKSTALGLLLRFYDPSSGAVTIDGVDVRRFSLESLRAEIGVVFQEAFLFDTTIRENIRLGAPHATDADVEAAAKAAEVDDFVRKLPDGYDTRVGERGARLSGGQRQRVSIARALVRNPSILVLDEATASLDPATAAAVRATLDRIGRGRTVISITHQLTAAASADRVFVFEDGRCVEQGRHAELCRGRGVYATLWARQAAADVAEQWPLSRAAAQ